MQAVERRIDDIRLIKGGLAWLLWQEGLVVDVVDHRGIDIGPGVYRKGVTEGNTINNRAIKCNTKQDAAIRCARGDLT